MNIPSIIALWSDYSTYYWTDWAYLEEKYVVPTRSKFSLDMRIKVSRIRLVPKSLTCPFHAVQQCVSVTLDFVRASVGMQYRVALICWRVQYRLFRARGPDAANGWQDVDLHATLSWRDFSLVSRCWRIHC